MAFLPVQVIFVTFIINRFLNIMEKRKNAKKINVIISAFYVEAGASIMRTMSEFSQNHNEVSIAIQKEFKKINVNETKGFVKSLNFDIYADPNKLDKLSVLLAEKKAFTLSMLENSNLMEHDSFTDMLWAVFHVADELQTRGDLKNLSKGVVNHLSNDILRAYSALVQEWIAYMFYLHTDYPYLYETAKNKSPFNKL
jgi:hypothetical protein